MSILIAPVPAPAPVQEPAMVAALRGQIARGASDAVLLRIAGGLAEYRRLARDFGLRPVIGLQPACRPRPAVAARAIAPPRVVSPSAMRSPAGPDPGAADSSQPPDDALHAGRTQPPARPSAAAGAADDPQMPPTGGRGSPRPTRRKADQPDEVTALLRDIARVRRDLAAIERRRS